MDKIIQKVLISETEILARCKTLGQQITQDYKNKDLVVIGLLKGCIPFLSDLTKNIDLILEVQYMVASSYHGSTTSGEIQIKYDLENPIAGKDVLIVEDIIDTGQTINTIMNLLKARGAKSIEVVTLLDKIANNNLRAKYIGFEIPNEFVVGYGLDFQQKFRNVPYIGILKKEFYDTKGEWMYDESTKETIK